MKFQQIRGATTKITYAGKCFLVDPFFAEKDAFPPFGSCFRPELRWPTSPLPFSPEEAMHGIDAVIMTHFHPDHFDEYAAKALPKDIKFFAQDEWDADIVKKLGFTNVETLEYSGSKFGEAELCKTDCVHGDPEKTKRFYDAFGIRGKASGVVFKNPGEKTFYLAGDTIWADCVRRALGRYSPDVVAVNAAGAQFLTGGLIIMGTDDVLKVREAAPEALIIVSHMDAVPHASVSRADMRRFIEAEHLENIAVPEDGEILTL